MAVYVFRYYKMAPISSWPCPSTCEDHSYRILLRALTVYIESVLT